MQDKNKQTASSCGESLELKQQRLIRVEANIMHLVFLIRLSFLTLVLRAVIVIFFPPICDSQHLTSNAAWPAL